MNKKHEEIEFRISEINDAIEGLEVLLKNISDIKMKANIRTRISELEKERFILNQILNF